MKKSNINMLEGSITKGLLALTIPIMIMNTMQVLFNTVDMAILKIFSDDNAVGAVGACGTLIALFTNLLIGIAAGANIVVARRLGEKNKERADRAGMTSLIIALVGGLLLAVIGVTFSETFLKMTNCPDRLMSQAVVYFKLYFYGIPVFMLYNFLASILRAAGDTKRPMYFLILAGILKVVFTTLFAMFFDMDVEGVAYATIIANAVACILAFFTLLKLKDVVSINFKQIKFDISELKSILYVGIPAGLQSSLYSFANVVIVTAVNGLGADATTGMSIANQFDGILYQITLASSLAVAPYVAQNVGAGNLNRVRKTVVSGILITAVFGIVFGSLSAIFSRQLSAFMSDSPSVIAFSQQKMIVVSSTYFICGINEVFCGTLRGLGKPIAPTISSLIYMCALRFVWVYLVFPLCPNLTVLYTVWPIGWSLSIATLLVVYFRRIVVLKKENQLKLSFE